MGRRNLRFGVWLEGKIHFIDFGPKDLVFYFQAYTTRLAMGTKNQEFLTWPGDVAFNFSFTLFKLTPSAVLLCEFRDYRSDRNLGTLPDRCAGDGSIMDMFA